MGSKALTFGRLIRMQVLGAALASGACTALWAQCPTANPPANLTVTNLQQSVQTATTNLTAPQSGGTLTIGGSPIVDFQSGTKIDLLPGFTVQAGTSGLVFQASIGPVITNPVLPAGPLGSPYYVTLTAAEGSPTGSFTWTLGGLLPAGLSFNSGVISGTPTQTGTFCPYITVSDSGRQLLPQQIALVIYSGLTITTTSLPNGTVGSAYGPSGGGVTLAASGGSSPYSNWVVSQGALPPGLILDQSTGLLHGTPTTASGSQFNFTVTVKDNTGATSPGQNLSIAVGSASTTTSLTSSVNPSAFGQSTTLQATISPSTATGTVTFKDGTTTLGSGAVTISGGTASLPISTLSTGSHSLTAAYSGDANDAASTSTTLTQVVSSGFAITTTSPPNGTVGGAYGPSGGGVTLAASGGAPPYHSWAVSTGTLPPGLTLASSSGIVSGTPTTATGSPFNFTVTVTDSNGLVSPGQPLSITVGFGTLVTEYIRLGTQVIAIEHTSH